MPATIVTDAEIVAFAVRSGSTGFSGPDVTAANLRTTDRIRQAALNQYTAESFESLTPGTAPDEMRDHALALALGILTKADAQRGENITAAYDEAVRWLGFVVAGRTHYDESPDAVLVKNEIAESGVSYKAPERKFDRSKNDYWGIPRR